MLNFFDAPREKSLARAGNMSTKNEEEVKKKEKMYMKHIIFFCVREQWRMLCSKEIYIFV